ncbi:MAG TPA: DUF721 domain-containing protein [Coxiellaceae bacterium]|nr:DUF721 domain-containing protein [Coxiellaceae bacterium]
MMNTQYPEENSSGETSKDPQLVQHCLKQGTLKRLVEKAHFLMALDQALQEVLSPEYQAHCQVMNLEGTNLIVGVNNAIWATRLRYEGRDILAKLKTKLKGLEGVTSLQVRVMV